MRIFSYHLVKLPLHKAVQLMLFPIRSNRINGLIHAETMSVMTLGSAIISPTRFFNTKIAVLMQWENEIYLNAFLQSNSTGKLLAKGWHIRLAFIRQWGQFSKFQIPLLEEETPVENKPVVALTIARMKYTQIPRFLRWGKPVEKLVRDHKGTILSLASIRYPNTISTFSIWKTPKEMTDMVYGHSAMKHPKRHLHAMNERNRKDFHYEFTTLRFKPIAEFGAWQGATNFILNN